MQNNAVHMYINLSFLLFVNVLKIESSMKPKQKEISYFFLKDLVLFLKLHYTQIQRSFILGVV